jgi:excinuclease ABC subunit B
MFKLESQLKPGGDQPQAIKKLSENISRGIESQVLLGVTGSGKTMTIAGVIEKTQKPILVISPNKTLCAQLYQEFKEFFPKNAVHYFVSYYDYYQPEAYIPQTDTYIEKDAKVNEVIDRLRHEATQDLLTRKDVIIIASVSCIYNIGSPDTYQKISLEIEKGQKIKRKDFFSHLISLQYRRNDLDFKPGTFRARGNNIDVFLVTGKELLRVEFSGDRIERISFSPASLSPAFRLFEGKYHIYPAQFWVAPQGKIDIALENIRLEMEEQIARLKKEKKFLEAQRLEQKTKYDLEMLQEFGWCHGIENYSRHLEFRNPGDPPFTLLDYFDYSFSESGKSKKPGYIVCIDESHLTLPQIKAMALQDKIRKETLIRHGFRLPSALDNRPLNFREFEEKTKQTVYLSATPGEYETKKAKKKYIIEQLIRPTGLLEPAVEIRPTANQVKNLIKEIKERTKRKERVLALTLTKRLAEALSDRLAEEGIKTRWLHSEINTLERPKILAGLRKGDYDVLVGINLLREGLDLPEVSLVAILDADKEGFLRNRTTLIQTMGRAARHINGRAILYADKNTKSIAEAKKEILRRRKIQAKFNKERNISPRPVKKEIREWPFASEEKEKEVISEIFRGKDIKFLEKQMKMAAKNLDFERAAELRDLANQLKEKRDYPAQKS